MKNNRTAILFQINSLGIHNNQIPFHYSIPYVR